MGGPFRRHFALCSMAGGSGAPARHSCFGSPTLNPPNHMQGTLKATPDQAEVLLVDLEKRARILQECSEKLETQLKVMLVQQSRDHLPNELVPRIANALAVCLISRGDLEQAGQYAKMAANLERRNAGIHVDVGGLPVRAKATSPEADSTPAQTPRAGEVAPDSVRRLPRSFASLWSSWTALNLRNARRPGQDR
jgi:hypothetical protein